jgi:hypothetical protein
VLYTEANRKGERTAGYAVCHASNSLLFLLIAIFVTQVMASDERRGGVLYRFAHAADFNSFRLAAVSGLMSLMCFIWTAAEAKYSSLPSSAPVKISSLRCTLC